MLEVLGAVVIDIGEAHDIAEVGVPSGGKVHPLSQSRLPLRSRCRCSESMVDCARKASSDCLWGKANACSMAWSTEPSARARGV